MTNDPAEMSPEEAAKYEEAEREQYEASASSIIACTDVLDLFEQEIANVIAGEKQNAKLLYLIGTSRLFRKPMHAAIKGTSSGGKSELRKSVLQFFPDEAVVSFTTLTEKALYYLPDSLSHKILSMGEAAGTEEQDLQDYLLRELMSEGKLSHMVAQQNGKDWETATIEKEGPVSFWVTTTKGALHEENETRLLSLEIDDTERQTRDVLRMVADIEGLNTPSAIINVEPWQNFQRWLAVGNIKVVVPYAKDLGRIIPASSVRLRRDFGQILRAVKAHALIHREHRRVDDQGQVVADIEHDYAAVHGLMNGIVAASSGVAVKPEMRKTVEAVEIATVNMGAEGGATAFEVGKQLSLDKSTALRRLQTASAEGYVVNLETRRGQRGRYRLTEQKMEAPETVKMLPEPQTLVQSTQPCNRTPEAEEIQEDIGCKPPRNHSQPPEVSKARLQAIAKPNATVNTRNNIEKTLPVARLHGLHGGGVIGALPEAHIDDWYMFQERIAVIAESGEVTSKEADEWARAEIMEPGMRLSGRSDPTVMCRSKEKSHAS